ncbi:MAG: efflux RND transporter permease subunit [Nitrospiraceae bacterium]
MNISETCIRRPVATTLVTFAVTLIGVIAFQFLPVASLPQVEFPTILVLATLLGGSPETMVSSVAGPLEHQFARIAGVTEMTSTSMLGSTSITLQFELSRDIDGAARDVQGAISAARGDLPANSNNPTYRKINRWRTRRSRFPVPDLGHRGARPPRRRTRASSSRSCPRSKASDRSLSAADRSRPCGST